MGISVLGQMLLCAVPDVEHMHRVTLDGEEDTRVRWLPLAAFAHTDYIFNPVLNNCSVFLGFF